jgi:nicotinamidase-related amidase
MRLTPTTSLLAVIDVQERLLAAIPEADRVVARCTRLADAARILSVKAVLMEQYPKGLGPTAPALATALPPSATKMSFSCCGCDGFVAALEPEITTVVLAGLETHVCIAQTALDLLARGLGVCLAVDAITSRHALDHEIALRRLEAAGTILSTSEAILFEWCRSAEHPQFQKIRRLVT